jgi:hypothetical protein
VEVRLAKGRQIRTIDATHSVRKEGLQQRA